jgi:integrase
MKIMGLTKRKDSYYVEFPVLDDGKVLKLARGIKGARLKRWKVGCLNKGIARDMEAKIKTDLLMGKLHSEDAKPILFSEWAKTYLALEEVSRLKSYQDRVEIMERQLVPFFGKRLLSQIKPEEVRAFRSQRKRRDGKPASLQTVNNDHIVLKHCLNVAAKRGLLVSNPATLVPLPNPQNERDRVLNDEEWKNLYQAAKPHLRPILLIAYHLGQRLGEIVHLTWDRVDLKRGSSRCGSGYEDHEATTGAYDSRCEDDIAATSEGEKPCNKARLLVQGKADQGVSVGPLELL